MLSILFYVCFIRFRKFQTIPSFQFLKKKIKNEYYILLNTLWGWVSIYIVVQLFGAFQVVLVVKNLPANEKVIKRHRFSPWVGKITWRRAQQPVPVFLPGGSIGQKNREGHSSQGHKESDTTEAAQHTHMDVASSPF